MESSESILITGAGGLVGKNLALFLRENGFKNLVTPRSADCDLSDRTATRALFNHYRPAYVFHMAGRVRGLMGNMQAQGAAYYENTLMNTNVVDACREYEVKKIVAMGTVAMYPSPLPSNPLREDTIWQGPPHKSEYGYAQAKRGMLAQLEAYHENYGLPFVVALATNLYGPHDRFNVETGHVMPSLVKKFYDAKMAGADVTIWGDGTALRDFLYIEDTVRALRLLMERYEGLINLATGTSHTISEVVDILAHHTKMEQHVVYDKTKPNGQIFRAYDVSKLQNLGFSPNFSLEEGLTKTYDWFAANLRDARLL